MPERDISSLGVMGLGGWTWPEILPPSSPPPSSSPPSGGRGRGEAGGIRNTSYTGAILHADRKSNGSDYKSMEGIIRVCWDYKSMLGL